MQGTLNNLDSDDPNKLDIVSYSTPTDKTPYLIVSQNLIVEDRDTNTVSEHTVLANVRFTFEKYGESIYPNGFKCNWLLGTLSKQIYSDNSVYFMVEVDLVNSLGIKETVIASGKVKNKTVENFNVDRNY